MDILKNLKIVWWLEEIEAKVKFKVLELLSYNNNL